MARMPNREEKETKAQQREAGKLFESAYQGLTQSLWLLAWLAWFLVDVVLTLISVVTTAISTVLGFLASILNSISAVLAKVSGVIADTKKEMEGNWRGWRALKERAAKVAERFEAAEG